MSSSNKPLPKDAQVMGAILKDMGISDYEPRVINHMLEFTYKYVTDVLDDAKVYSVHSGKKEIDTEDVKLSVQCKLDHSFTTPPPKHLLMDIAKQKNSIPLPPIKPYTGPKLPPDRYCLSATNYRLRTIKKPKTSNPIMIQGMHPASRMGTQMGGSTPQMITVRSTPVTAPMSQQHMYRLNPTGQGFQAAFSSATGGVKRKLEDDDYDVS